MKCERCGKDDAVVKITRVESTGRAFQVALCQSCAAEASPYQKKAMEKQATFNLLLKHLLTQQKVHVADEESAQKVTVDPCPSCGLDYSSYKATYMLGCPDCYEAFAEALEEDLQKFHRTTVHLTAEAPQKSELVLRQEQLQAMRDELKSSIEFEDFERAAFLRDEIVKLEKEVQEERTGESKKEEKLSKEEKKS